MGCPVIRKQKGEKPLVLSSGAEALLERYKSKVGTNCTDHVKRLEKCRTQVVHGNVATCIKEAEEFESCSTQYHREREKIKRNCEHILSVYHVSLRENFLHCLGNHKGEEYICEQKLQKFVECASLAV